MSLRPSETGTNTVGGIGVEVGCGSGEHVQIAGALLVVGVDRDLATLSIAARSSGAGVAWVCADALRLPMADGAVEQVTLRAVLHHLTPVEVAVAEIARIVRPDGTVTIIDGVALGPDVARRLDEELVAAGLPAEPTYGFEVDQLIEQLSRCGLWTESVEHDGVATFATPPFVSRPYRSDRFALRARKR